MKAGALWLVTFLTTFVAARLWVSGSVPEAAVLTVAALVSAVAYLVELTSDKKARR